MDIESIFNTIFFINILRKMDIGFHFSMSMSLNGKSKLEFKVEYRNNN